MASKVGVGLLSLGSVIGLVGFGLILEAFVMAKDGTDASIDKMSIILSVGVMAFSIGAAMAVFTAAVLARKEAQQAKEVQQSPKEPGVVKKLFRKAAEGVCPQRDTVAQRT